MAEDAADTVKRATLELGGKSPNIVFADCDLEERVMVSVQECFYNTGQSCDAPTRLLVKRARYDWVLEIAQRVAEAHSVGDPSQEGDHIDSLFDRIQYDRVQAMIKAGTTKARLLTGGLASRMDLIPGGSSNRPCSPMFETTCASLKKRSSARFW